MGLTAQEVEEQATLRRQYLDEFKANMRQTLDNVYLEQEDGSYKKLEQKPKKN